MCDGWGFLWGGLLFLIIIPGCAIGQSGEFLKKFTGHQASEKVEYRISVTGSSYSNWAHDPRFSNFLLLQNAKYDFSSLHKKITFSNQVIHNLGFQIFPDSISRFGPDDNTITTRINLQLLKPLGVSLASVITTSIFNSWEYFSDSGNMNRRLSSGFLSPLVWNLSGGISCTAGKAGNILLGLTALRLTIISDKRIFCGNDMMFGVRRAKGYQLDYGLSLQFTADRDLASWVHWNCDLFFFKKNDASPWDLNWKNNFGFRISRFLRLDLQTKLLYEEKISKKLQFENLLSIGVVFFK